MIAAQQSDFKTDGYDRARHIFAVFIAGAIFTLILAGALVTSNDAGLSVPDWPTSFGSIYKIPPMVGGVRFEHGHRMLAEFVGLLTIILATLDLANGRTPLDAKLGHRRSCRRDHARHSRRPHGAVLSSPCSFYRSRSSRTNILLDYSDHRDLHRPDVSVGSQKVSSALAGVGSRASH